MFVNVRIMVLYLLGHNIEVEELGISEDDFLSVQNNVYMIPALNKRNVHSECMSVSYLALMIVIQNNGSLV